jgi:aspartate-semialdehyde dehydrogenase
MKKIRAAVVGATGIAGQQFLAALSGHPQIELVRLAASPRSAGKKYRAAITDPSGRSGWYIPDALDPRYAELMVEDAAQMSADGLDVVFTAIESEPAKEVEPRLAQHVPVISTASAFRYENDVPLFLPAVNLGHVGLLDTQRKLRGWKGFITPGPNCTTVGLAITLAPLRDAFGINQVIMTSMQAVSGAGRSPGVIALDITDNLIPYIPKEEEKVEKETKKILGVFDGGRGTITDHDVVVSCTCTRVAVLEGHTESVFVGLKKKASVDEVKAAMRSFGHELKALGLHSMPDALITVEDDPFRPQPRFDRDRDGGMTTTVGRIRVDPVLGGVKYVLCSHNTKMGAAKGAILTAEYLAHRGYIG